MKSEKVMKLAVSVAASLVQEGDVCKVMKSSVKVARVNEEDIAFELENYWETMPKHQMQLTLVHKGLRSDWAEKLVHWWYDNRIAREHILRGGGTWEWVEATLDVLSMGKEITAGLPLRNMLRGPRAQVGVGDVVVCTSSGRVEVIVGEARSADVKKGDEFKITKHDQWRYYGTLNIKGMGFRHDPGLSGKPTQPGVFHPGRMEFAIMKENVDNPMNHESFWAQWES